jgi:hypothetical protein
LANSYYKFLDAADVPRVLKDGTVVVSSFDYFRKLEEKEWGLIADRLEGATVLTTTKPMVIRENSPELAMLNNANIGLGMFKQFAKVSGGGVINMGGGISFVHQIPGHIYCASVGKLEDLAAYMTKKAERPYNACLHIKDLPGLAHKILNEGKIAGSDKPFSDLFARAAVDVVQYIERSRAIEDGPVIEPTPFAKGKLFSEQSEVRIYFEPKIGAPAPPDRVIVKIDTPESIFEEVIL